MLSSVEVYKKECLGLLLGIGSLARIIVNHAVPFQAVSERKFCSVKSNWKKEVALRETLPKLANLDYLGDFHSHPQFGNSKGTAQLSETDKQSIKETKIELVIAINTSKHRLKWSVSKGELFGSLCDYNIRIAGFYKSKNGEIKQLDIICPYAIGFDSALNCKK
ncbi:MAG: Mov34/MPN/PAD-1 family protein [Candidatus Bathyarchaeota archaeon]|nr:Mov34/MPN/PAD-1 family protein [Candidatus Bathyarchaeota archaeon]